MEGVRRQPLHPVDARAVMLGGCVLGFVKGNERSSRKRWSLAGQRLSELEAIMRSRHGVCVDDDNASSYLRPLAAAAANASRAAHAKKGNEVTSGQLIAAVVATCRLWLPNLAQDEIEEEAHDAVDTPRFEKADTLGKLLGVSFAERKVLGLRTIGCREMKKRQRTALVKADKADRQRAKRRASGMKPRSEYEANSIKAIAISWGVSRQTIYNWRKQGDQRGFYKCETHTDNTVCASDMSNEAAGGFYAPLAAQSGICHNRVAKALFSPDERRLKLANILHRASTMLRVAI
jgi:transposase-like protein